MHTVGEVDVDDAARLEHGGVAGRTAPEGVGAGVGLAPVGLYLRQAHGDGAVRVCRGEDGPQEGGGGLEAVAPQHLGHLGGHARARYRPCRRVRGWRYPALAGVPGH